MWSFRSELEDFVMRNCRKGSELLFPISNVNFMLDWILFKSARNVPFPNIRRYNEDVVNITGVMFDWTYASASKFFYRVCLLEQYWCDCYIYHNLSRENSIYSQPEVVKAEEETVFNTMVKPKSCLPTTLSNSVLVYNFSDISIGKVSQDCYCFHCTQWNKYVLKMLSLKYVKCNWRSL